MGRLFQWAQCNYNDRYKREVRGSESEKEMCPGNREWSHASSPTKECGQLLEARKGKEAFSPQEPPKKNVVLLTHLEHPGLHNYKIINLCCLSH